MRRALSLWFPAFSTDLVRRKREQHQSDEPREVVRGQVPENCVIVLTRQVGARELVVRRCRCAAVAGIMEGMDLAHARSLLRAGTVMHVEPHQPGREAAALHAMACWALRFSPLAAPDPPDGLAIDITGTQRLHRGESRLIRTVTAAAGRLGFHARAAIASTFACAWGMARFAANDLSLVPPGGEREALADLPVAALGVDENTVGALREIGITHIAHVLDLPRASIAARFSPVLLERLNQALGRAKEQIKPVRPMPPPRAELLLDGPTDRWESIEAAARHVLDDLAGQLARCGRGVRLLDLQLISPHADAQRIEIRLSRPSASARHLWSLMRSRLERLDLGQGVEGIILTASRTAHLRHEQTINPSLDERTDHATEAAWGELVDTLATRLGAQNIVRIAPVESHLPERTFIEMSIMEKALRGSGALVTTVDHPTILLPRPESVQVMALTPDGPVLNVGWRGRRWRVIACVGPERIGAEWWRWGAEPKSDPFEGQRKKRHLKSRGRNAQPPPDRDYFAVQIETGRWLWVFRHVGTSRWFVHGQWS